MKSLTRWIAEVCGLVIRIAGGHVRVVDATLLADSGFGIEVANGCNAINVLVLLWAAQLAWPAGSWLDKLKRLGIGTAIILVVNGIRIISLYYLGQWNRDWFEWMHLYVWEALIMLLGMSIFAMGIRRTPVSAVAGGPK